MSKKKSGIGKMLVGVGIGAGLGMLLAPKSGKETRKDIKNQADKMVKKVKDIDLNQVKEDLMKDFEKFKKELADMDAEKAKKLAKQKGKELADKANELMELAKEKGMPVVEKAAKDMKKKLSDVLADWSEKLDD